MIFSPLENKKALVHFIVKNILIKMNGRNPMAFLFLCDVLVTQFSLDVYSTL